MLRWAFGQRQHRAAVGGELKREHAKGKGEP